MPTRRNVLKPGSRAHRGSPRTAVAELPAGGCGLPVPPLPKGRSWSLPERTRWRELWSSPQAVMWDEATAATVAVLVVYESAILAGTAAAWQAQEARYAADALGLTPKSMSALGWVIVDD